MYNPKSLKAEEFINDLEIKETLAYADENKDNLELIDSILEKAKERKGLSHREASVLLACDNEGRIKEMYELAEQIKKDFYGNRIVMFAPLYLSNYCINGCKYCPYHVSNKHIARKKLTQEDIRREVIALQDMGHKRLAIEAGEDPQNNPDQRATMHITRRQWTELWRAVSMMWGLECCLGLSFTGMNLQDFLCMRSIWRQYTAWDLTQ